MSHSPPEVGGTLRVEICGGIASGKTTLCALLGRNGWQPIFENFRENPFWRQFGHDPKLYAFETEVTFLLQHYSQIKIARRDTARIACDFSLLQDRAYAEVNLGGGQLGAFRATYHQAVSEVGDPALLVRLECDAEVELARIRQRARAEEHGMTLGYLGRLNQAIARSANRVKGMVRVLVIDSAAEDFATNASAQRRAVEGIVGALRE